MNRFKSYWILLIAFAGLAATATASGATKAEINAKADAALVTFNEKIKGGDSVLKTAKGYLIFPSVIKAGFGVGFDTGDGVLRVGGKTVAYYNTSSASLGLQIGVQERSEIIAFMDADALKKFQASKGWKAGVDASVALVTVGAGGEVDTSMLNKPVVGFIFGTTGLMYNLSFEGSKITKIKPK